MIMMDFMYGITGRSCIKSNSDSLKKSVDKSFYDSRGFFAVNVLRFQSRCVMVINLCIHTLCSPNIG